MRQDRPRSSCHFELPFFSISSAHKALPSNTWQFQWKVMQIHSCPTNQNTHQVPTKPCRAWHHSVAVLRPVQDMEATGATGGGRSKSTPQLNPQRAPWFRTAWNNSLKTKAWQTCLAHQDEQYRQTMTDQTTNSKRKDLNHTYQSHRTQPRYIHIVIDSDVIHPWCQI